ncbi:GNAT family protein [Actinomyces sp. MRS3W]|uniref:GNAT family N-acetyltransferase n=1 Tax=Actinomyces sp. MRS3W TaxID=2800796 RepID=UPI0028FD80F0|nr:GNAT family protein [Actinomyces sp. MRS3W]MDU0348990.1 GNAT family protein [Actinomyces sp. MRS3W]
MSTRQIVNQALEAHRFELAYYAMTPEVALEIADEWKYAPPYDFYDMTADPEDYDEFVTPDRWPDVFLQVRLLGELFGYLTGDLHERGSVLEIGLGMHPDFVGRGLGLDFMKHNLAWVTDNLEVGSIRLSVASFNERAITVYRRSGFREVRHYQQRTNGSTFDFMEMRYDHPGA